MILMKNITKTYDSQHFDFKALDDISIEIEQGEFLSIMGRSGCGKTTLLNILGGIDSASSGSYLFSEKNVLEMPRKELAKFRANNIGFIFQAFHLIDELNCIDNVSLTLGYVGVSRKERDKLAMTLLNQVGLSGKERSYPSHLSGGEQQRVAIARAIANNPKVILADEPTGNLDYNNGIEIMSLLKRLNEDGTTVVMVTHDAEFSKYAQRIVQMQDGRFV